MKYITVIGCKKCRRCDSICPAMAIEHIDGTARVKIIHEKCNLCMICITKSVPSSRDIPTRFTPIVNYKYHRSYIYELQWTGKNLFKIPPLPQPVH